MSDDDIMRDLRARFCARLTSDIQSLAEAGAQDDRAAMRSICHRIAGAGGMFGFAQLSAAASDAEEAIDAHAPLPPLQARIARVLALAAEATTGMCGAQAAP